MNKTPQKLLTYALLALMAMWFLLPLAWMVSVSFKPPQELARPSLLPEQPNADAYLSVLGVDTKHAHAIDGDAAKAQQRPVNLLLYARNTVIIMVLSLAGVLLSCSIAAYGFARIPFPGRDIMFGICLATMMIPFPVIMVPTYMLFKQLDWIGTFKPLWVPAWFGSAFNIFLLRQFFMGIPKELEESAQIDGCSRWGCFWRIMLPLSTPVLVVVALFHCMAVWNDLVGPMIYLTHEEHYTLALGLQVLFSRSGDTPWNEMMAASTLIVLPVLVLFLLAQQTFIKGIATSGIKG